MGKIIKSGKLKDLINDDTRRVLLFCNHGLGDVLSFRSVFQSIKSKWPKIHFDFGINNSMGYDKIIPEAISISVLEEHVKNYDIVYVIKYHMENFSDSGITKSEKCCLEEIGISPISSHLPVKKFPLISVHFNSTCMPQKLGCPELIAETIWREIISCGCVPIETHFIHRFHDPQNKKFKCVDMNCRDFNPCIDSLTSLIGSSFAFVGVVSGNMHLALSLLPPEKIFLLTNEINSGHITKLPISNASVTNYKGEVLTWLENLTKEKRVC